MSKISKMGRGVQGLRFRCGGYTKLDGAALPPGVDPDTTALLVIEGDAVIPCPDSIVLSLGHKGRIDLKHLRRSMENVGWLIALVDPTMSAAGVMISDPLCPTHGAILATRLMKQEGTPAHVIGHMTGYLRRAAAAIKARMEAENAAEAAISEKDQPLTPVAVEETDEAPAAP
jgi:hypothetical protein